MVDECRWVQCSYDVRTGGAMRRTGRDADVVWLMVSSISPHLAHPGCRWRPHTSIRPSRTMRRSRRASTWTRSWQTFLSTFPPVRARTPR